MTPAAQRCLGVRITGVLTNDAQLVASTGPEPHYLLMMSVQPPQGLPYDARLDIGTNVADHMQAEALLPRLRRNALVSVNAFGTLPQRTDHGHAVIPLIRPHGLVVVMDADHRRPPEMPQ